ncbi:4'-phosphopantetheinyl transferase family protein [Paenibacillus sp. Marseille-Q9583]
MEIIALKLPEIIPTNVYQLFLTRIGKEKKTRILKYQHIRSAYHSLFGELLVRAIICHNTSINNPEIDFIVGRYGKPFLKNYPNFSFNISHSGHWVVLIWNNQKVALGIDVEEIKLIDLKIAETFFHRTEYLDLLSKQGIEQTEYFFQLWTLKESYIKAVGKGLAIPLDNFSFHCSGTKILNSPETRGYYFKSYRIDAGHYISACSNTDTLPENIKFMKYEDLCGFFFNQSKSLN